MVKSQVNPDTPNRDDNTEPMGRDKAVVSMHDNVPVWYDCCSCEAEPYWLEAMRIEPDHGDKDAG